MSEEQHGRLLCPYKDWYLYCKYKQREIIGMVESMCYAMDKIDQSQQPVSH